MKKLIFKILLLSLFTRLFVSCATFPKAIENKHIINEETIDLLNGAYAMKEISRSSLTDSTYFSFSKTDGWYTFFDEIDSRIFNKRFEIDSSKSYSFELEVLNSKSIRLNYLVNETTIRQHIIKYKIKDDGYIYLKNRNFKIRGIPYLFGDINVKRNRITLNKENNLQFESSEFSSGGIALLMVYPVAKAKYQKIYERIK